MRSLVDDSLVMDDISSYKWLQENRYYQVRKFLEENFNPSVIDEEFNRLLEQPLASYSLIKQFFEPNQKKYDLMLERLSSFGYICIVVGAKGGGKTACVTGRIVPDLVRKGCKVAYVGMPQNVPFFMNDWKSVKKSGGKISFFYDFFTVPSDYIIVQDESAILENAKNFGDKGQKEKEDILPILRHKGNSIIFISQHFSFLSKRVRDFADMFIIKPFNLMQLLKENSDTEFPFPSVVKSLIPKNKNELMFIDGMHGVKLMTHDVEQFYIDSPDFWGKTFRNLESEIDAQEFINALFENNYPAEKVWHLLRLRGYNKPLGYYKLKEKIKVQATE